MTTGDGELHRLPVGFGAGRLFSGGGDLLRGQAVEAVKENPFAHRTVKKWFEQRWASQE